LRGRQRCLVRARDDVKHAAARREDDEQQREEELQWREDVLRAPYREIVMCHGDEAKRKA
jgi:hypothetical protein